MVIGTKPEILLDIGVRMRTRRLALNLSPAEAAMRSGLSEATVKNLETGKGISLWGFVSLCRTYGNDGWVYGLTPESVDDYAERIRPVKRRQRATKRKESAHV